MSASPGTGRCSGVSFMLRAFASYSGTKTESSSVALPQRLAMDGVDSPTSAPRTQSQKSISQRVFLISLC